MNSTYATKTITKRVWTLEIDEQEALFLKVLCGMQTGSDTQSYRKYATAFYNAVKDVDTRSYAHMKHNLMELRPAGWEFTGCSPAINWKDGFVECC